MKTRVRRKALGEALRQRGIPISDSTLNKMCAPSRGDGPPVDGWWGPYPLYDLDAGIAWAEGRLRPERETVATPDCAIPGTTAETGTNTS